MIYVLQSLYLAILNPAYVLMGRIPRSVRDGIFQGLCFAFPVFFILRHSLILKQFFPTETSQHILGSFLIIALTVFSINTPLKRVSWRPFIAYPLILSGIGMLLISMIHTVGDGYRVFGLMLIFVYPCLYFVWSNRQDYDSLFFPLSRAACITGIALFVLCFCLAFCGKFEILYGRATGPMGNPNNLSMFGMIVSCCALYILPKKTTSLKLHVFYSFVLGVGFAMTLLGASRVSILVCLINAVISIMLWIKFRTKGNFGSVARRLALSVCIAISVIVISTAIPYLQHSNGQSDLSEVLNDNQKTFVASTATHSYRSSSVNDEQEPSVGVFNRFGRSDDRDINNYSSGRLDTWKDYLKHLNMLGNDFYSVDWKKISSDPSHHAHNNFLEIAFRFGIPVGIIFMISEVAAGIISIRFLFFNRRQYDYLLFPILFMLMFALESMLEVAALPFERISPCYYYIALIPMIDRNLDFNHPLDKLKTTHLNTAKAQGKC